jgi:4'-phosphopantetheinyl transferase EntD
VIGSSVIGSSVIGSILPPEVVAVEAFADSPVALFPEEEAVVARAVAKRRNEFATVRACARAALAQLGQPPVPILPGTRGAPIWPAGVVGSMTHCDGYRACALALGSAVRAIGLDAEPDQPLPAGVLGLVSLEPERDMLAALPPGPHWDRLLFCAKESVYKAWFPLALRWLDFAEAEVALLPDGTFTARLLVPGPTVDGRELTGFTGRWLASRGLLVAAIVVPAGSPLR